MLTMLSQVIVNIDMFARKLDYIKLYVLNFIETLFDN